MYSILLVIICQVRLFTTLKNIIILSVKEAISFLLSKSCLCSSSRCFSEHFPTLRRTIISYWSRSVLLRSRWLVEGGASCITEVYVRHLRLKGDRQVRGALGARAWQIILLGRKAGTTADLKLWP